MIEIGTRVTVKTLFTEQTGTIQAYRSGPDSTQIYMVLLDDDGVTPPELRLMGSTVVTPVIGT